MLQRKIVDASVWIGWLDASDFFHSTCRSFFEEVSRTRETQIVVPIHLLFEVNAKIRAKKRVGNFLSLAPFEAHGPEFYAIDSMFLKTCQDKNIWDIFSVPGVGSQDLIYAAISFIENIPLVTTDRKMADAIATKIKIELLS